MGWHREQGDGTVDTRLGWQEGRRGLQVAKTNPMGSASIVGERDLARFKIDFAPSSHFPLPKGMREGEVPSFDPGRLSAGCGREGISYMMLALGEEQTK